MSLSTVSERVTFWPDNAALDGREDAGVAC